MAKAGLNIDQCRAAIGPNQKVIAACRAAKIPVIFTRYTLRPDYKDAGLLGEIYPALRESGAMVVGTRDWEIAEFGRLNAEYFLAGKRQLKPELAREALGGIAQARLFAGRCARDLEAADQIRDFLRQRFE